MIDGVPKEVLKYDFSQREAFHVHYFYRKPEVKQDLPLDTNQSPEGIFEEMISHSDYIKKNWKQLKRKYLEK
jgi:hypothetical protein